MIDAGVDGLFFLGSSGEVVFHRRASSPDYRRGRPYRRPPLVFPFWSASSIPRPSACIEHGKVAQELGADALVATCPFYAPAGHDRVGSTSVSCEGSTCPSSPMTFPSAFTPSSPGSSVAKLGAEGVLAGVKGFLG